MNSKLYLPEDPVRPGIQYKTSTFPAGEGYVKVLTPGMLPETVDIHYRYAGDHSLIMLFNFTNALRLKGVRKINLFSPYFPGIRSDRVTKKNEGEALSCQVYVQLVNSQNYDQVVIFDPHNETAINELKNRRVVDNHHFVNLALNQIVEDYVVVSPDAGAAKKIGDLLMENNIKKPLIHADKLRDADGRLIPGKSTVHATKEQIEGKTCVIVDDICSRGGTFLAIVKALQELGAARVILVVSHYEGTADEAYLKEQGIDMVYTTTSLINARPGGGFVNTTDIISLTC